MSAKATCIEVAVNGPWTRRVQPCMPQSPEEIVADAVACARAGASVVHFHAYDVGSGEQTTDLALVTQIIEGIRAQCDAIVYPAIRYMPNAEAIRDDAGPRRYAHLDAMAARGIAEWLIVDPGSTNLVGYRDIQNNANGAVDINTPAAVRHGLEVAARHRLHPGFAIYEPGYLRLAAALCRAVPGVPAPVYRFMFSEQFTYGFAPREYALRTYLTMLEEEAPGAAWMVAGLGVDIRPLLPLAIRLGGHVRVGIEDYPLGSSTTNLELVRQARALIEANGSRVATPAEVRASLQPSL